MTASSEDIIRIALANRAYRTGTIRLVDPDLATCSHLIATRHGLFATDRRTVRRIAHGLFYGLTVRDDLIFAFEAGDRPHNPSCHGRIVRFRRDGDRIVAADIVATGLDNGCHQIDIIDDRLCVVDTYNQRILRYALEGGGPEILYPIGAAGAGFERQGSARDGRESENGPGDWAHGYAHMNSIVAQGDHILLLLHNGADKTDRPSEIVRLDRAWRPIDRIPLDGLGCHSLAVLDGGAGLDGGAILTCGSFSGELISTDGLKIPVCDMMTRGLSVDGRDVGEEGGGIAVGGSAFADRASRDGEQGRVFFLDGRYRPLGSVAVPAPVMDIRRIDGRDRSLSSYLARQPS